MGFAWMGRGGLHPTMSRALSFRAWSCVLRGLQTIQISRGDYSRERESTSTWCSRTSSWEVQNFADMIMIYVEERESSSSSLGSGEARGCYYQFEGWRADLRTRTRWRFGGFCGVRCLGRGEGRELPLRRDRVRGRCRKGTCDMGLWVADVSVAFVAHVMDVSGILLRVAHAF